MGPETHPPFEADLRNAAFRCASCRIRKRIRNSTWNGAETLQLRSHRIRTAIRSAIETRPKRHGLL
eukprot:3229854-Alexandrium_andersonii.AAC.1